MSIDFLVTALIVVVAPGTGVIYTVATGLAAGRAASIAAAFGCTLGIVPAMLAAVMGLAAIMHTSALLFQFVKFCGVAYLLYLAWMTLRDDGPLSIEGRETSKRNLVAIARTGALINVLNPKLSVFFLAFLPQFVDPTSGAATAQMLYLGGVFMALTFAVFVLYGAFASYVGEKVLRRPSVMVWVRRGVAAAFAGFGVRLALSER